MLSQKDRSSIYAGLRPIIGEEEAEALLAQFPSRDVDEPLRRDYLDARLSELRAEMAEQRGELRAEMVQLRGDLRGEMAELRMDLRGEMAELRMELSGEVAELRMELSGEVAELRMELSGEMVELRGEQGGLRGEVAALEVRLTDRFRRQTTLMVAVVAAGTTITSALSALLG